jgi:isopentenyl phosphate kinase
MPQHANNVYLKLGGSLITDKNRAYTVHTETITRLASEVQQALTANPNLRLLIGHGSGSFGHWAAKPYGTRQGVQTLTQWRGYTEVAAAAARLNRIVADAFLEAGVPVLSVQPSASARCHDGELEYMDTRPVHAAMTQGLVPLVYGDVALDDVRGGTIISTEDIFLFIAKELCPSRILLLGKVAGVQDLDGNLIPHITLSNLPSLSSALAGSAGTDVTGGMKDKVMQMVHLVQRNPETDAYILTGIEPGLLTRALIETDLQVGTRISVQ